MENKFIEALKIAGEAKRIIHSGENTWEMDYLEMAGQTYEEDDDLWLDFTAVHNDPDKFPGIKKERIPRREWWISEYRYTWVDR